MAYQQKKKKKSRPKKRTEALADADTSTCSEPTSLIAGVNQQTEPFDSLGGNESPIPFDDFGHPSLEDNLSLPVDPSTRLSTSLPIVSKHVP